MSRKRPPLFFGGGRLRVRGLLGAFSAEFQEDRREKNPFDDTLTLVALDHEVPIHVKVHRYGHRLTLASPDFVIEHDLDAALAAARYH